MSAITTSLCKQVYLRGITSALPFDYRRITGWYVRFIEACEISQSSIVLSKITETIDSTAIVADNSD